jgi:hypothetical protein
MKYPIAALSCLGLAATLAACAPPPPPLVLAPGEVIGPRCIYARNIDHIDYPNDHTMLFHMNDRAGTVYKNTLSQACFGKYLSDNAFIYTPTDPASGEICGELQTIKMLRTREVCVLGPFTTLPLAK